MGLVECLVAKLLKREKNYKRKERKNVSSQSWKKNCSLRASILRGHSKKKKKKLAELCKDESIFGNNISICRSVPVSNFI